MGVNLGQDLIHGESVRDYCDNAEKDLGIYHGNTDAAGNRYEGPEEILLFLIRQLRTEVPEPEEMED